MNMYAWPLRPARLKWLGIMAFAAAVYPDRPYPECRLKGLEGGASLEQGVGECGSSAVRNAR